MSLRVCGCPVQHGAAICTGRGMVRDVSAEIFYKSASCRAFISISLTDTANLNIHTPATRIIAVTMDFTPMTFHAWKPPPSPLAMALEISHMAGLNGYEGGRKSRAWQWMVTIISLFRRFQRYTVSWWTCREMTYKWEIYHFRCFLIQFLKLIILTYDHCDPILTRNPRIDYEGYPLGQYEVTVGQHDRIKSNQSIKSTSTNAIQLNYSHYEQSPC